MMPTVIQSELCDEEIARRGEAIYEERLRKTVEIPENLGKILVVDIETGDYEIDSNGLSANNRLQVKRPNGVFYGLRIGFDVVEGIGGFAPHRNAA